MRQGDPTSDENAVLTCDRCGWSLDITPNTTPDGWRFLMTNTATVAADLCPECVASVMAQVAAR